MSTEIARVEAPSSALVTREYLAEKAQLVRELYAKGTNDLEFEHFIEVCATRGLNPLAKQIYCVMRKVNENGKWVERPTIQTSIDGYRLIAQRTGEYRGQVGPEWCGPDGAWREVWLDETTPPAAARVGVLREGFAEPLYGVARWASYVQTTKEGNPTKFWKAMPDVMLAKVAESLALRKAFPEELSGLYTADEMQQATPAPIEYPVGSWQSRWSELQERATLEGYTLDELKARLRDLGVSKPSDFGDDAVWNVALSAVGHEAPSETVEGEIVDDPKADTPRPDRLEPDDEPRLAAVEAAIAGQAELV